MMADERCIDPACSLAGPHDHNGVKVRAKWGVEEALAALYLELPATVADDIARIVRERLASLQAELAEYRALADEQTERLEETHEKLGAARDALTEITARCRAAEAQLALCDAVVEAARFCLEHGQIMNNGDRVADAIAALGASENPRGATPNEEDRND